MLKRFRNSSARRIYFIYSVVVLALAQAAGEVALRYGWPYVPAGARLAALALLAVALLRALAFEASDLLDEIEDVARGLACFVALMCLRVFALPGYGPVNPFEIAAAALFSYFGLPNVIGLVMSQYYVLSQRTARGLLMRAEEEDHAGLERP